MIMFDVGPDVKTKLFRSGEKTSISDQMNEWFASNTGCKVVFVQTYTTFEVSYVRIIYIERS